MKDKYEVAIKWLALGQLPMLLATHIQLKGSAFQLHIVTMQANEEEY